MRRITFAIAALFMGLGAPTALAPAAAQGQIVSGPFMVFFNTDEVEVTPQGLAILDNVAAIYNANIAASPDNAPRRVMIDGHTDTMKQGEAAVGESMGRITSVRRHLVERGIPADQIVVEAFGSERTLVDTGPGVSEPQNRRVEITFFGMDGW